MSIRTLVAACALLAAVAPAALRAQEDDIDFARARKEFVGGNPRAAANTLLASSLGVRNQVGRCRDETVGQELLDAESGLEKLATALRAGSVKNVKELDEQLMKTDRSLAHHHLLLVQAVISRPRADNIPVAARDVDRAAFHYERSVTLNGTKLTPEQTAALEAMRKAGKEIETNNALPATLNATLKDFEKLITATAGK